MSPKRALSLSHAREMSVLGLPKTYTNTKSKCTCGPSVIMITPTYSWERGSHYSHSATTFHFGGLSSFMRTQMRSSTQSLQLHCLRLSPLSLHSYKISNRRKTWRKATNNCNKQDSKPRGVSIDVELQRFGRKGIVSYKLS